MRDEKIQDPTVGGGVVGLSSAVFLASHGLRCLLPKA